MYVEKLSCEHDLGYVDSLIQGKKSLTFLSPIVSVKSAAHCSQVSSVWGAIAPHNPGWCSAAHSTGPRPWHFVHGIHEAWRHVVTDSQMRKGESKSS